MKLVSFRFLFTFQTTRALHGFVAAIMARLYHSLSQFERGCFCQSSNTKILLISVLDVLTVEGPITYFAIKRSSLAQLLSYKAAFPSKFPNSATFVSQSKTFQFLEVARNLHCRSVKDSGYLSDCSVYPCSSRRSRAVYFFLAEISVYV